MKTLELLRARLEAALSERAAAIDEMEAPALAAQTENRSMTPEDASASAAAQAKVATIDADITELRARIVELEQIERATADLAKIKTVTFAGPKPATEDVLEDRTASSQALADAVTRSLEPRVDSPEDMAHVRSLLVRNRSDREWARNLLARSTEVYERAWAKVVTGGAMFLDDEERTVISTITSANGGYLVPTHLDPTVILANSGSSNVMRAYATIKTITAPGDNSWQGITSDGVTASFDAQLTEVSDDSPTFGTLTIPVHKAQALVQASLESVEDIQGLASEILAMFADAKDRLEGAAHMTGTGTDQPTGIFTALDANTNVEIVSTTAATISKADLNTVFRSVPVRWRKSSRWLMNPLWSLAIQDLGTTMNNSYSTNIAEGPSPLLFNKPVVESDDAPTATTTTVKDNQLIFGDLSQYFIVDKPGSFAVEYIPHLFNTSNNLPDGRRAWYAYWRTGGDVAVDTALRVYQDKTSA